jgi:hypothetical protein
LLIVSSLDTSVRVLFTLQYYLFIFCSIQFAQMPTKHPPSGTDSTEDGLSQHVKKKLERGRLSMTTSNDRPKRNATKPDKHNVAPLLAEYASVTISKTAASRPPISLRDNNNKHSTDPLDDGVNIKTLSSLKKIMEGPEALGATPSDSVVAASTNIKLASGLAMNEELFPTTVEFLSPPVGTSAINNSHTDVSTGNALVEGVLQLARPVASSTIPTDNRSESTGQISDISPYKRGNLKIDEDYEQGDPWDKFSFDDIKGQHFAVAVGKNENSFGIYADLRKFKEQIEGFPVCLCQSCESYTETRQYLEQYLQENIVNDKMEITSMAPAGTGKKWFSWL